MTLIDWILLLLFLVSLGIIGWQRSEFKYTLDRETKSNFMSVCLEKERVGHCEEELTEVQERLSEAHRSMVPKVQLTEALDLSTSLEQEVARLNSVLNLARESHSNAIVDIERLRSSTVPAEQLESALSEKSVAIQAAETLREEMQQALAKAQVELTNTEQQLHTIRASLMLKEAEVQQANSALEEKISALDAISAEHQQLQTQHEAHRASTVAKSEFEAIRESLTHLRSEHDNLHASTVPAAQFHSLQNNLAEHERLLADKHQAHDSVLAELEQTKAALAEQMQAFDEKHRAHDAAHKDLEQHKTSLAEKSAEIAVAAIALSQVKDVFSSQEQALRAEAEHLRHVLSDKEKSFTAAQTHAAADQRRLESEATAARRDLALLQQKLAEKDHALTALQESSAHVREQLESNRNNIRSELEQLRGEHAARSKALSDIQAHLDQSQQSLATLKSDLAAKDQALAAIRSELSHKEQTIASAKAEIAEKERAINEAQAATMEITRGYEAEAEAAEAEVVQLRAEIAAKQAAHAQAETARYRLATEFDSHRAASIPAAEHHALHSSFTEAQSRTAALEETIALLRKELAQVQTTHVPVTQLRATEASFVTKLETEKEHATSHLRSQLEAASATLASHRQNAQAEMDRLRAESDKNRAALANAQTAATDVARMLLERLGVAPASLIPSPAPERSQALGLTDAASEPAATTPSIDLSGSPLLASYDAHGDDATTVLTPTDRSHINEVSQQLTADLEELPAIDEEPLGSAALLPDMEAATLSSSPHTPTSLLLDEPDDASSLALSHDAAKDRLAQLRDAIHALAHSPAPAASAVALAAGAALGLAGDTAPVNPSSDTAPSIEAQAGSRRIRLYPISVAGDLATFCPDSLAWDGHRLWIAARGQENNKAHSVAGLWSLGSESRTIDKQPSVPLPPSSSNVLAPLVINGTGLWLGTAGDGVWHQSPNGEHSLRFSEAQGLPNARPNRAAIVSGQTFFAFATKEGSKVVHYSPSQQHWPAVQPSNGHVFGSVANLLSCGQWLAIVEHAGTIGRQSIRQEFLHLHKPSTGEWKLITDALELRPGALMGATTSSSDGSALWLQIRTPAPGWENLGRNARVIYNSQLVKLAIAADTGAASIAAIVPINLPEAYILLHHDGKLLWVATSKKINNPGDVTLYDSEVRAFDDVTLAPRGAFTLPTRAGVGALASSPDTLWMKSFTQLPGADSVPLFALRKAELVA